LFVQAVQDLLTLQYAEATALTQGTSLERFDIALEWAREKKDKIKLAFLLHTHKHRC
jgi:hypothetical protein